MKTFLQEVAQDLYHKLDGDFSHVAVVFPNKRASLFFSEALARIADRPIWSPAYLAISDLFRQQSPWTVGDPVKLICDLYQVYQQATGTDETLDDFYFWGEMLMSDFDDADKNMADTKTLFSNLKELNEIVADYDFLEEGQREAIRTFFHNFAIDDRTRLKAKFTSIWNSLGDIYNRFKARLEAQSIAYEGMLYRRVTETMQPHQWPYRKYVFVGFNVLNKVEHTLFTKLMKADKALFYWDYDVFYLKRTPHEAGEFIRRNLRDFPSELPQECFDHLNHKKEIVYVESPTENGQTRYLPQWIRTHLTPMEKETAVVLCNEALLEPVLHSIPKEVQHLNITMGFPLSQTPAYSFITALILLHTDGYNPKNGRFRFAQLISVLRHPYTRALSAEAERIESELTEKNRFYPLPSELQRDTHLELLFTPVAGNVALCRMLAEALKRVATLQLSETSAESEAFSQLYQESIFRAYTLVNRFVDLIGNEGLEVKTDTLSRLLTRVMQTVNIPFHGEPAIGMQVMGVLETRNLDFRHLVMLSVNEGLLPKTGGESSFIPYNLRKAFGMTTIDHKIAVYAYYFYRLLQRAEKVTLLYNTVTEGMRHGEQSRFMLQLLVEWGYEIKNMRLEAEQTPQQIEEINIEKNEAVMQKLRQRYDLNYNPKAMISPSALNTYLDCRLKFYYKYVAALKELDEVNAEIDAPKFGSIFHHVAEMIYNDLTAHDKVVTADELKQLMKDSRALHNYVDRGFKELFFKLGKDDKPEYNGLQLINSEVIVRYIRQLLERDAMYAPFTYLASEREIKEEIEIKSGDDSFKSCMGGSIDRMDMKDGTLRIVDYKTGGDAVVAADVASLFEPAERRPNYIFQTFLYSSLMCAKLRKHGKTEKISPALLYIHRAASANYNPTVQIGKWKDKAEVTDFACYEEEFRKKLNELLEEIFNPDIGFSQTNIVKHCEYCDFRQLCKR